MDTPSFYGKRKQQNVDSNSDLSENYSDISNSDGSDDDYVPDDDISSTDSDTSDFSSDSTDTQDENDGNQGDDSNQPQRKNDEWLKINLLHKIHTSGKIIPLLEAHFLFLAILDC